MINNEMKTVQVISYTTGTDEYGQLRQQGSVSRNIEMYYKIHSQSHVDDPRYLNIDMVGLTEDSSIDINNQIQIDNVLYQINYIIPSGRFTQVLMTKYGN